MSSLLTGKLLVSCRLGQSLVYQSFVRQPSWLTHQLSQSLNPQSCQCSHLRTFSCLSKVRAGLNSRSTHKFVIRHVTNSGRDTSNKTAILYISAIGIFMTGMAYAGVPLYRMFCQASGLGGQAVQGHDASNLENLIPVQERVITIRFNADTASSMQWNFRPQQTQVKVVPGETALAFYKAKNPTNLSIIGISTYNVVPFDAGQYFNKIQCFCFEEQILNPHEEVDMPVFFYIDPEFAEDPKMENVDTITLSYTFFEAKEGLQLPLPGYTTPYMPSKNPA